MEHGRESGIFSLAGEPLSAVAFVQDYVEFHFDGRIVRAFTRPIVRARKSVFRFPDPGSRDALCALIGCLVKSVDIRDDDLLTLVFSDGIRVEVSLRLPDRTGPEAVHYVPGRNQPIDVW